MSVLTDSDWQAITPSGRSPERVKSELEQGTYVVLRDSPASPVFSMEQGSPLASSAFAGGISAQTVSQLTNRFQSAGRVGAAAPNDGNLDPAPPLDYIADTSQVKEAKEEPKPVLISDNFGKAPPKLELQLCYDDSEKTYASDVPYSVIFSDPGKTVIKGVLNDQGWAMVEGGPNYPAKVIFGDEAEKAAAELALKDQYKQLDQALNDTAKQVVDHVLAAKEKAKQTQLIEVTESFKLAVDNKIAALNAESEAFDNLSYLSQTWEIAKATKEGASNGFTEYIPDLGDFGALMDAADIDITMLIEAISTGNIDTLEAKLQQWKDRGGQGLNEARKTMETLILLLSDPTSREMLASVPKRIIAALPEDQVAELTAYQTTQLGMDTAVVAGGAAVGTLAGGVGGPVAAGMLFAATTARKGGKALEGTINIVADISKSLKKINNQHDIVPYKKENTLPLATGKDKSNDKNDEDETYKCDWKDCKGGHKKKIKYPNNGQLKRSNTYRKKWVSAGLEPWDLYGPGENSHATLEDYKSESRASYVSKAAAMQYPEYHTQKHHLIPVSSFADYKNLKHNAKLAGYDVNNTQNGICLPSFVLDIVQHDLQCHRGNHPNDNYYDRIDPLLEDLQDEFNKVCAKNANEKHHQHALVKELDDLAQFISKRIKDWKYLLRSDAKSERIFSTKRMK
ncbi:AHH domain-containing protein [Shewanella woodyi]|uniref:AHH domain-containing protein n=1 Tax=Shewanella woodyi TaxID=60961 RepID=UPI0015F2D174|nr:AHH domain-containing protein [Shewanella woodyi]